MHRSAHLRIPRHRGESPHIRTAGHSRAGNTSSSIHTVRYSTRAHLGRGVWILGKHHAWMAPLHPARHELLLVLVLAQHHGSLDLLDL